MLSADLSLKLRTVGAPGRLPKPPAQPLVAFRGLREEGGGGPAGNSPSHCCDPPAAGTLQSEPDDAAGRRWRVLVSMERGCRCPGSEQGGEEGVEADGGTPRGLPWGHIKQTGLCPFPATLSRRNESCVKRDTNLFGQLIHHCKLPLFLGGLPLQGLQRALLMWAEKAPGVREDLIPLCRK